MFVLIYDMTDKPTLDYLAKYYKKIHDKAPGRPLIFVGTKSDKPDQEVSESDFKAFKNNKLYDLQDTPVEHLRVSAMKDAGLDRLEETWIKYVDILNKKKVKGSTALHSNATMPPEKKGGCC